MCVCTCFTGIQNPSERLSSSIINFNANSSCTSSAMDQKEAETAEQQSQPGAGTGAAPRGGGQAELSRAENQIPLKQLCAKEREREGDSECSKQCNSGVPPDGLRITERGER